MKKSEKTFHVYMGEDLKKQTKKVADEEERSVSSLIRKALKDYFKKLEKSARIDVEK